MISSRAVGFGIVAALALGAAGSAAVANGRFPQAQHLVAGPGRASEIVMVRATFGIVASDDGGGRFRFLCEDFFEFLDGYDPAVAVARDGTLLVGLPDGLIATRDWCTTTRRDELRGQSVTDLTTDPTGGIVLAALVSRDVVPVSRVARSTDGGQRFEVPREGLEGVRLDTVEIAGSAPLRVYATGRIGEAVVPAVYRSDDGGRSWRRTALRLDDAAGAYVSGVHPGRPDTLWIRVVRDRDDGGLAEGGSVLLRSDDGGETATEVGRTQGPMRGFALSDDGETVWMGGPDARDGLLRSVGGSAFVPIAARSVECLRQHAGSLWVCQSFVPGGVMLARSDNGGDRFVDALTFAALQGPPASCGAGSTMREVCPSRYVQVRSVIAPRPDAGTTLDAGLPDSGVATPPGSSCVCRGAPGSASTRGTGGLWALALGWAFRGRRRRDRGPADGLRCKGCDVHGC